MKSRKTLLTDIHENAANPRTISEDNLSLLINSILEFPKMLEMRPVVINQDGSILGGNMRHRALVKIAAMSIENIYERIDTLRSCQSKTPEEIESLKDFWSAWHSDAFAYTVDASSLSEVEKEAFIIKDNVNLGQWDWDMLDNFSSDDLRDWGVQTWGALEPLSGNHIMEPPAGTTESRERIIVIFPKDRVAEIKELLHLGEQPHKQVYRINELTSRQTDE